MHESKAGGQPPDDADATAWEMFLQLAAENDGALGTILQRRRARLIGLARRFIESAGLHDPAIGPEDVVSETVGRYLRAIRRNKMGTLRGGREHWKYISTTMRRVVQCASRHDSVVRREHSRQGRNGDPETTRAACDGEEGGSAHDQRDRDGAFYPHLPSPEDQALVNLEVDEFLVALDEAGSICGEIPRRKLESYTDREIAASLGVSERTIERRMREIRREFRHIHAEG